jgi:hypothetical protein
MFCNVLKSNFFSVFKIVVWDVQWLKPRLPIFTITNKNIIITDRSGIKNSIDRCMIIPCRSRNAATHGQLKKIFIYFWWKYEQSVVYRYSHWTSQMTILKTEKDLDFKTLQNIYKTTYVGTKGIFVKHSMYCKTTYMLKDP